MKSLAYFDCKETLKKIVNDHPILIYFLCHLNDPIRFTEEPFIDKQEDCNKLENHGLTEYTSPKERPSHFMTLKSCHLTRLGKSVYNELYNKDICDEILNLINKIKKKEKKSYINKETFAQEFFNHFTFDEDPSKIIENKINEIKEKYYINIPENHHDIKINRNNIHIEYTVENEIFYINFIINCACSKRKKTYIKVEEKDEHFKNAHPYNIECQYCNSIFIISHNLYFCMDKIKKNFHYDENIYKFKL